METLNKFNRLFFISLLFILVVSCKNTAQNGKISNSEILKSLPDDIANKTWIFIHDKPEDLKYNTYKNIIDYGADGAVKTEKNVFHTVLDIYETYFFQIQFDTVIIEKDTYKIQFNHPEIDYAKFKWVDKNKGIGDWEIRYLRYRDGMEETVSFRCVDETFVTSENYPELKPEKIVLEEEKLEDITQYERITSLPIEGKFACANEPTSFLSFKYKETKLYNNEAEVVELQPYEAILSLTNQIYLVCSLRKVKGTLNKYVFLFNHTFNTDYHPNDISYYSINQPIAEIEIIDNNTIKNKWIGMYNRHTKQYEGYGVYNWIDTCDNTLSKIEE